MNELVFHITARDQWQRAQQAGLYYPESLDTDGFIHCSTATQVIPVANFYYRGQVDLVLLGVDTARTGAEIRYEPGYDGDLYPHLYGALKVSAVCRVIDLEPDPSGNFALPEEMEPYAC
ncbi:MAG: DUF952 domain-containing protein [Anaerolineae bacterium]|nr:DUF952 domain-containing protein [Anaerolineae bacterium]